MRAVLVAYVSLAVGLAAGNHIKAWRYRRAVDIGFKDGFADGRITAPRVTVPRDPITSE